MEFTINEHLTESDAAQINEIIADALIDADVLEFENVTWQIQVTVTLSE